MTSFHGALRAVLRSRSPIFRSLTAGLLALAIASGVNSAAFADGASLAPKAGSWYMLFGVAVINFDSSTDVNYAGTNVPGNSGEVRDDVTLGLGIGYFLTPNISIAGLGGVPPETTLDGRGEFAGLSAGKVTYGPAVLAVNYHFTQFGAFQPFVGAGVNYTIVLNEKDLGVRKLKVDNAWGYVARGGFDVMMTDNFGFTFSAQKIFVDTDAKGTFGGLPVSATVDLDPWIFHGGLVYRF